MTRIALALALALATVALLGTAAAQAQTVLNPTPGMNAGAGGGNIAAHKQKELAKIQQKMGVLQTLQSCVSAAQTSQVIQQCNETARASMGHHEKKC